MLPRARSLAFLALCPLVLVGLALASWYGYGWLMERAPGCGCGY